jgi:hypothetical protein
MSIFAPLLVHFALIEAELALLQMRERRVN